MLEKTAPNDGGDTTPRGVDATNGRDEWQRGVIVNMT